MTPEQFASLPLSVALQVLCRVSPELVTALEAVPVPEIPRAGGPKYDASIFRKDGVMYASECSLSTLRYWHGRAAESALSGSKYAEKDAKKADVLRRWIAYREAYPDTAWTGERNNRTVTSAKPTDRPTVYAKEARDSSGDGAGPAAGDDPIPFAKWSPP